MLKKNPQPMTRIEKVVKEVSDLRDFYLKIQNEVYSSIAGG
jgi:hypothetical protein